MNYVYTSYSIFFMVEYYAITNLLGGIIQYCML